MGQMGHRQWTTWLTIQLRRVRYADSQRDLGVVDLGLAEAGEAWRSALPQVLALA